MDSNIIQKEEVNMPSMSCKVLKWSSFIACPVKVLFISLEQINHYEILEAEVYISIDWETFGVRSQV